MADYALNFQLDFRYREQTSPALKQVSGAVLPGQCVVLCGSSGCGKSTLLRCINQLIPQFYEGELKGFCHIQGTDLRELSIGETGRLAASVFQDPRSQFFTMNSSTEVAFGLENFGMSQAEMAERVDRAFAQFHLERLRDRNVFSMSSGERQLVAILSAWAMDTDILLLDEPTANLDWGAVTQLRCLLEQLKSQGKTLIISEHRLYYLSGLADVYWQMENGEIVRRYSAGEMLALPPMALQAAGLRTADLKTVTCSPAAAPEATKIHSLQAQQVCFSYERSQPILHQMSLELHTGQVVALVGSNGCGKTTFGKLAAGLLKPSKGRFLWDQVPATTKKLAYQGIFIMQETEFQFFTNSVFRELLYGIKANAEKKKEAEQLLKLAGLWQCRDQHPFSLSGGQMQKLVLLMACISPKPVVILDEPTAGLDYKSLQVCTELIAKMRQTKIVLVITHDLELIGGICSHCVCMEKGGKSRILALEQGEAFREVKDFLQNTAPEERKTADQSADSLLDPRTKLLMFLLAMGIGVWTDIPLMLCAFVGVLASAAIERHWKLMTAAIGLMGSIFLLYGLLPCTATSFIINFFPRIFLIGAAAAQIVQQQEAPRTLAALRKLHVPEQIIMICAVTFRFFPVLNLDLKIMLQSIRTRGFFPRFGDKIRAVPQYAEILIVPMVFRVLRIAEALSASAETRGIALRGRRDAYTLLKFTGRDLAVIILFLALLAAGLIV